VSLYSRRAITREFYVRQYTVFLRHKDTKNIWNNKLNHDFFTILLISYPNFLPKILQQHLVAHCVVITRIKSISQRIHVVRWSFQPFLNIFLRLNDDIAIALKLPMCFCCFFGEFVAWRDCRIKAVFRIKPVAQTPIQIRSHICKRVFAGYVFQPFCSLWILTRLRTAVA